MSLYLKSLFFHGKIGLGDRHQQVVEGVATNYTLDLAAGLTQVLDDGTSTYLYGNSRIAQAGSTTEYFLGDALGSVRQLADPAGVVTLTQSYAPYGDVVSSVGISQTNYAFTGESRDANELTYLRARYYVPQDGRFISRDTWGGDYNNPLSLNRWNYVMGNPVNYTDPSGMRCAQLNCLSNNYSPSLPVSDGLAVSLMPLAESGCLGFDFPFFAPPKRGM